MHKPLFVLWIIVALLAGCSTSGVGSGYLRADAGSAVTVDWKSRNSVGGSMSVSLSDGRVFSGSYFQITSESRIERLQPLWSGWHPAWRGWAYWHREPVTELMRHYSGRILANLRAENGEHLRCRIRLARPGSGLAGGGEGTCQLPDGSAVQLTFSTD